MDGTSLVRALRELGVGQREFARWTGANERTVRRWCRGELDVARWVGPMLGLMEMAAGRGERPWEADASGDRIAGDGA